MSLGQIHDDAAAAECTYIASDVILCNVTSQYFHADEGNVTTIEAMVPVSCCRVNRDNTEFPGEVDFVDVNDCLQDPTEENAYLRVSFTPYLAIALSNHLYFIKLT